MKDRISLLLKTRDDIMVYKFFESMQKKISQDSQEKNESKTFLTDMIHVDESLLNKIKKKEEVLNPEDFAKEPEIRDLDAYIASLNLDDSDIEELGIEKPQPKKRMTHVLLDRDWNTMVNMVEQSPSFWIHCMVKTVKLK